MRRSTLSAAAGRLPAPSAAMRRVQSGKDMLRGRSTRQAPAERRIKRAAASGARGDATRSWKLDTTRAARTRAQRPGRCSAPHPPGTTTLAQTTGAPGGWDAPVAACNERSGHRNRRVGVSCRRRAAQLAAGVRHRGAPDAGAALGAWWRLRCGCGRRVVRSGCARQARQEFVQLRRRHLVRPRPHRRLLATRLVAAPQAGPGRRRGGVQLVQSGRLMPLRRLHGAPRRAGGGPARRPAQDATQAPPSPTRRGSALPFRRGPLLGKVFGAS
jgi:hypothetical protein